MSIEGFLLRTERLRQGKEQKEVCAGICAISTLSKLENGHHQAHPDLLKALYQALGISYCDDEEVLAPYRKLIEEYFSKWEEWLHHGLGERILKRANLLRYSPLAIDFLLIEALEEKEEALALLEACQEHLSPREKGFSSFQRL